MEHTPLRQRTVNDLLPGECAVIAGIDAPDVTRQRLMDLGIIEGARVEMIRSAPLGDPVVVRVLSTTLALRRSEARMLVIAHGTERCHGRKAHRHRFGWKS